MSEKNSGSYSPGSINTLIGPSTHIEGDINCPGVLRVQGDIHGNVLCDAGPEGALVVDSAGTVDGSVRATHVAVRGRVVGPLQSSQSIEVHQGGSIAGDLYFKELAIHAGGIVEGSLKPTHRRDDPAAADPGQGGATAGKAAEPQADRRPGGTRKLAAAAALAAVVIAAAWLNRDLIVGPHAPAEDAALRAEASLAQPAEIKPRDDREAERVAQAAPSPAVAADNAPSASEPAEAGQEAVLTVKGTNPNRPTGVFLLIGNESSALYRKKRHDPGEGARIAVSAGEKASVSIDEDELIRFDKGSDATIFYQGQKVPRQFIASGSWIKFVAAR